jgi:hypothetical protein
MSSLDIVIKLLEKVVLTSKKEAAGTEQIVDALRRDNISTIVKLDTSITTLTAINLNTLIGGRVRTLTVIDIGGGLSVQTSIGDPFTVHNGDFIEDEEIDVLRWYGAGAGTAIVRITGLRL